MTKPQVSAVFADLTCGSAMVPQARVELATFRLGEGPSKASHVHFRGPASHIDVRFA